MLGSRAYRSNNSGRSRGRRYGVVPTQPRSVQRSLWLIDYLNLFYRQPALLMRFSRLASVAKIQKPRLMPPPRRVRSRSGAGSQTPTFPGSRLPDTHLPGERAPRHPAFRGAGSQTPTFPGCRTADTQLSGSRIREAGSQTSIFPGGCQITDTHLPGGCGTTDTQLPRGVPDHRHPPSRRRAEPGSQTLARNPDRRHPPFRSARATRFA